MTVELDETRRLILMSLRYAKRRYVNRSDIDKTDLDFLLDQKLLEKRTKYTYKLTDHGKNVAEGKET